ncbi:MAG: hypothetical protein M0P59_05340 [Gallionella sp.]|nr:hypothetical protein [Gallionella sp.]MCK9353567.1 hypothetical protein [Gallionella sp.]
MKKLLISSVVAVLCGGAPAVYAVDEHHPEQGGTPAAKSAPEKTVQPGQPAAPDKAMSGPGGITDAQMVKAQERMRQAQALMSKLREAKDPAERKRLMQEHAQALRDTMGMMRGKTMMGMVGSGQGMGMGMGMMGQGKGPQAQAGDMMPMYQMMEGRMEMMQMMMEQMMQREEMRDAMSRK